MENNLKVNVKKCQWFRERVTYLGHVISFITSEGVATDPDKVKAIVDWPQPKKSKHLKSFMGLASLYRRFIPNFSSIAKPLHGLSNKEEITALLDYGGN
jgi:hypothetical protein